MKTITITDILTESEVKRAIAAFRRDRDGFHKWAVGLIEPKIAEINARLGQENDVAYLAFAVEYVISKGVGQ